MAVSVLLPEKPVAQPFNPYRQPTDLEKILQGVNIAAGVFGVAADVGKIQESFAQSQHLKDLQPYIAAQTEEANQNASKLLAETQNMDSINAAQAKGIYTPQQFSQFVDKNKLRGASPDEPNAFSQQIQQGNTVDDNGNTVPSNFKTVWLAPISGTASDKVEAAQAANSNAEARLKNSQAGEQEFKNNLLNKPFGVNQSDQGPSNYQTNVMDSFLPKDLNEVILKKQGENIESHKNLNVLQPIIDKFEDPNTPLADKITFGSDRLKAEVTGNRINPKVAEMLLTPLDMMNITGPGPRHYWYAPELFLHGIQQAAFICAGM